MQVLNQLKKFRNMKKSHKLLIGSLLIFVSIVMFSWNYLEKMKDTIFSDMKIAMMGVTPIEQIEEKTSDSKIVNEHYEEEQNYTIDYSKYLGVLEIPKIGLKRGFYNIGSRYNNIEYNVTLVGGSDLPDVDRGNLILMAHSGDAYISYFAYLYRLSIGDDCYVTYNGNNYHYQIVDIYDVDKIGIVSIRRDKSKNTLTMITCTKDNDYLQTIYIAELIG